MNSFHLSTTPLHLPNYHPSRLVLITWANQYQIKIGCSRMRIETTSVKQRILPNLKPLVAIGGRNFPHGCRKFRGSGGSKPVRSLWRSTSVRRGSCGRGCASRRADPYSVQRMVWVEGGSSGYCGSYPANQRVLTIANAAFNSLNLAPGMRLVIRTPTIGIVNLIMLRSRNIMVPLIT